MQLLIFAPRMDPLVHIHMYIGNTASQGWSNMGSVSIDSSVGPIMQELSLSDRRQHIHASVGHVPGEDNNMADAASWLTHLTDRQFLSHSRTNFPQNSPRSLLPLSSLCKQLLTNMLHNNQYPRGYPLPFSRRTPPPDNNGGASASGSKSPPTSKILKTPFPSSRFPPSTSVPAFCPRTVNLSRSNRLSNTSAQLVKSSHPWGPTTPVTTA